MLQYTHDPAKQMESSATFCKWRKTSDMKTWISMSRYNPRELSRLKLESEYPPALDDSDENHDDRDHEQDVDEPTHRGAGHQTKQPKNDKDCCDGH
jgi:hypothetical protein